MKIQTTSLETQLQFVYANIVRNGTKNFNAEKALKKLNEAYETVNAEIDEDLLEEFVMNVSTWLEENTTDYENIIEFLNQ